LACLVVGARHGDRVVAFDAHRACLLALQEAIRVATPARLEELCRIVVARVLVRDRDVQAIARTPPLRPFLGKKTAGVPPRGLEDPPAVF
jgi:hypothetical protein